jgi:hypothetical protein
MMDVLDCKSAAVRALDGMQEIVSTAHPRTDCAGSRSHARISHVVQPATPCCATDEPRMVLATDRCVLAEAVRPSGVFAAPALPRIVFVLGKGGVGRSTISAALGLVCAERGERALVMEWAVADAIAPWFGAAPAGPTPVEVAPRLAVENFALDEALRSYFVDHLHLGVVYRRVVQARAVTRMIEVAPGLAEMFFLGQLWWLITLAEREAGWRFDRIVVDAPATGHAASLLDIPSLASAMAGAPLLAAETRRVVDMMADPARALRTPRLRPRASSAAGPGRSDKGAARSDDRGAA